MIDLAYFGAEADAAAQILGALERRLGELVRRPVRVRLVAKLDPDTREQVLQLKTEVFGPGQEVFDDRGLDEVAVDPDALLVTVEIAGSLEGFCFGYYEEPSDPIVEGSAFFLDTAAMSARWRGLGVGTLVMSTVLVLLGLLGDIPRVGLAVWAGGDSDRLVALYRRLGFVDATGRRVAPPCMSMDIDDDLVYRWRSALGVASGPTVGTRRTDGGAH